MRWSKPVFPGFELRAQHALQENPAPAPPGGGLPTHSLSVSCTPFLMLRGSDLLTP